MLDNQSVEYFLNQLSDVQLLETLAPRKKILKLRTIFREIFTKITENEKQFFSSNFAKVVFSLDKMHTDKSFSSQIKKLNYTFNKAASNQDYKVSEGTVNYAIELLKLLINEFSRDKNENINKELNYFQFQEQERKQKFEHQFIGFLQAVVVRKFDYIQREGYDFASLSIYTNEFDDVTLQVDKKWLGIWKIAWKGALLNLFDVKLESSKELKIQTTSSSLIIIEPDYLVDVTDISECFHSNGYNPYLYFFKKYRLNETTLPLVTGNIANYFFDELISNPEIEFKTLFEKALKYKPLQLFALATKDKAYYKELKETSYNYYNIIRDLIPDIIYDSISVEPSFIS
jgi:hypothetical protein